MASRKEQKEQARAARVAQEQQANASAQRTRRLQILGGLVVVVVAVVVIAIIVSSGGSGGGGKVGNDSQTQAAVRQVNTLLNGIPQHGNTLGNPSAKVRLEYFGDLECPICQDFTLNVFPTFVNQEVRTGKVKVVYKSLCTATCNNQSVPNAEDTFYTQQVAALAAGPQSKFWNYTDLFYHLQGQEDTAYVTESFLTGLAEHTTGLDVSTWKQARNNAAFKAQVTADAKLAAKYGTSSTPSLFMFGPKGAQEVGAGGVPTAQQLAAAVQAVS